MPSTVAWRTCPQCTKASWRPLSTAPGCRQPCLKAAEKADRDGARPSGSAGPRVPAPRRHACQLLVAMPQLLPGLLRGWGGSSALLLASRLAVWKPPFQQKLPSTHLPTPNQPLHPSCRASEALLGAVQPCRQEQHCLMGPQGSLPSAPQCSAPCLDRPEDPSAMFRLPCHHLVDLPPLIKCSGTHLGVLTQIQTPIAVTRKTSYPSRRPWRSLGFECPPPSSPCQQLPKGWENGRSPPEDPSLCCTEGLSEPYDSCKNARNHSSNSSGKAAVHWQVARGWLHWSAFTHVMAKPKCPWNWFWTPQILLRRKGHRPNNWAFFPTFSIFCCANTGWLLHSIWPQRLYSYRRKEAFISLQRASNSSLAFLTPNPFSCLSSKQDPGDMKATYAAQSDLTFPIHLAEPPRSHDILPFPSPCRGPHQPCPQRLLPLTTAAQKMKNARIQKDWAPGIRSALTAVAPTVKIIVL